MTRCQAIVLVLALTPTNACSLAPGKGLGITNVDKTNSEGSMRPNGVRLQFALYNDDGRIVDQQQGIFDTATRALAPHDNTMEWMPTIWGYTDTSASGTFDLPTHTATVAVPGGSNATFVLPNATTAVWWYSAALARVLFVYTSTSSLDYVAACTVEGACVHGVAPNNIGYLDPSSTGHQAMVWDEESLVGLPLMCCVCRSFDYYAFRLAAGGALELTPVPPLNTLGVVWYDTAAKVVWASPRAFSGYGDSTLTVKRYDYARHQLESFEVPIASVEQLFALPGWAVAVITVASVLVVLGLVTVAVAVLRARRAKRAKKSGLEAKPEAGKMPACSTSEESWGMK